MISIDLLSFLSDLKANNNREWFEQNRKRYEASKKEFVNSINKLIPEVAKIDPLVSNIEAKDCIFRIFRDVRFSKNKTPYKPNYGAFISKGGRKSYHAGYYLHIEAGESFIAGGVYMPETPVLKLIRQEIFYNPKEYLKLTENKSFKEYFTEVQGEKLKTSPKGFDKEFKYIDLLRFKSFTVMHRVDDEVVASKDFQNYVLKVFKTMQPFNSFMNEAIQDVDVSQLKCK